MTTPDDINEIATLVGPVWSETKVVESLDVTRAALRQMRVDGFVLGLTTLEGDTFFPVAQFENRDGAVRVKVALQPLFSALRSHDPWAVAVLLHTPAPELDDLTPLSWLAGGGAPDTLASLARCVEREWRSN
jgi:hypothetical protein